MCLNRHCFRMSEAYILHTDRLLGYSERDLRVVFLDRDVGLMCGAAPGALSKKGRYGSLQQLCKVSLKWVDSGKDMVRIRSAKTIRFPRVLYHDYDGMLVSSCISEHVTVFAQESEPDGLIYRLLDATVSALVAGCDRDLAMRYFEYWVLRIQGAMPSVTCCSCCGNRLNGTVLWVEDSGILCKGCAGKGQVVRSRTIDAMNKFGSPLNNLNVSSDCLSGIEQLCRSVRRSFLGYELKSYGLFAGAGARSGVRRIGSPGTFRERERTAGARRECSVAAGAGAPEVAR